jgi:hypothetical protein
MKLDSSPSAHRNQFDSNCAATAAPSDVPKPSPEPAPRPGDIASSDKPEPISKEELSRLVVDPNFDVSR